MIVLTVRHYHLLGKFLTKVQKLNEFKANKKYSTPLQLVFIYFTEIILECFTMLQWKAMVLYIVFCCVLIATGEDIFVFKFEPQMLTEEYDNSLVKISANQNVGYSKVKQK